MSTAKQATLTDFRVITNEGAEPSIGFKIYEDDGNAAEYAFPLELAIHTSNKLLTYAAKAKSEGE